MTGICPRLPARRRATVTPAGEAPGADCRCAFPLIKPPLDLDTASRYTSRPEKVSWGPICRGLNCGYAGHRRLLDHRLCGDEVHQEDGTLPATEEVIKMELLRSSPESVSPRSPGGLRMIPVLATVPADVVLRTINLQDDYSFFLFLVDVHHSTIRPADLRLSASKSVVQQRIRCRTTLRSLISGMPAWWPESPITSAL